MKPKKPKEVKDEISRLRLTKRSGAYVPNSTRTGITKGNRAEQKEHKTKMKAAIKSLKRGL